MTAARSRFAPPPEVDPAAAAAAAEADEGDQEDLGLIFTYDSRLWLKVSSSRPVKELWRECEKRLKVRNKVHGSAQA